MRIILALSTIGLTFSLFSGVTVALPTPSTISISPIVTPSPRVTSPLPNSRSLTARPGTLPSVPPSEYCQTYRHNHPSAQTCVAVINDSGHALSVDANTFQPSYTGKPHDVLIIADSSFMSAVKLYVQYTGKNPNTGAMRCMGLSKAPLSMEQESIAIPMIQAMSCVN